MTFDWDGLGPLVPIVLWLLFVLLRKIRPQAAPQVEVEEDDEPALPTETPVRSEAPPSSYEPAPTMTRRSRRRRHDETGGFERHYDPIEPSSW